MFLKRFFLTLLVCAVLTNVFGGSHPEPGVVTISYGDHDLICYSLRAGTMEVYHHGKKVLYNIEAIVKADNKTYSSKDYTEHKYSVTNISDGFGKGKKHTITMAGPGLPAMTQVFYTYPGRNYFLTDVELTGKDLSSNYMTPLQGDFTSPGDDVRSLFVPFDNDTFISYESHAFRPST